MGFYVQQSAQRPLNEGMLRSSRGSSHDATELHDGVVVGAHVSVTGMVKESRVWHAGAANTLTEIANPVPPTPVTGITTPLPTRRHATVATLIAHLHGRRRSYESVARQP
jgi:hypothetical protein